MRFSSFLLILLAVLPLWSFGNEQGTNKGEKPEEALWLRYPAISPSGERIAFAYKGDLYWVDRNGGEAQRLTSHPANELHPVWGPDGQKLAFVSDRYGNDDIFIMPSKGGEAQRLTYYSRDERPSAFTEDGRSVIFSSTRLDDHRSAVFPHRVRSELYKVPVNGGRDERISTIPAEEAVPDEKGRMLYQDRKGYEDRYRKHHTSSVTKDIWLYEPDDERYRKLTEFEGEDRDPVWAGSDSYYYLSERNGDLNVFKGSIDQDRSPEAITELEDHPCRSLSRSENGILCFSYDGQLYTVQDSEEAQKVEVFTHTDKQENERQIVPVKGRVGEMALSPNGEEIAFVNRGEVFVTSIDHKDTKRITDTPTEERSVIWGEEGRSVIYASEREGSWNIYRSSIAREEEKYFFSSTLVEEKPVIENDKESFQPRLSPEGGKLAYLEDRTTLKVKDLEDGSEKVLMPGDRSYSYKDGDQWFRWSPDGEWLLVQFNGHERWPPKEVGVVDADGEKGLINLTNSGYDDTRPKWAMNGEAMIWFSDRHGMRSHGSWGSEKDAYALFFDKKAQEVHNMSKSEYGLWKEEQKEKHDQEEEPVDPIVTDPEDRKERLTIHSSQLSDAVMGPEGENLYYISPFENGHALWRHAFHDDETKIITKFKGRAGHLIQDQDERKLYLIAKGRILQVDPGSGKKDRIKVASEMTVDKEAERERLFEHVWRQTKEKFYVKDMHGVDWSFYKKEYKKFLPHISNARDFTVLLSEMLGELNASHTGARHIHRKKRADRTASPGLYLESQKDIEGLRVTAVMPNGPFDSPDSKARSGIILEAIDGEELDPSVDHWSLLNRKKGKRTLFSFYDPEEDERWEEVIRPISLGKEKKLRYERWVEERKELVDSLSDQKVGYVHVKNMNDASFRRVYKEALGRYNTRDALILDTRFNGGGWLHEDLASFLSGEAYLRFSPRGQENLGGEPGNKWTKKSCVLMNEGNYSDAHLFPFVYKNLGIGKLIGMPVPGTGTAVWWEHLMTGNIVFGIPQVGMKARDGTLVENEELQPHIKIDNPPEEMAQGKDAQLERAVQKMLKGDE